MKVVKVLGDIGCGRTALIIDNEYFPYYIVHGYKGGTKGDNLWDWTVYYTDNVLEFAKAITVYADIPVSYYRLDEMASKAIDHIIEQDPYDAEEWLKDELELTDEEVEYFCVGDTLDEAKGLLEEDEI
jgi:hypothetical protein